MGEWKKGEGIIWAILRQKKFLGKIICSIGQWPTSKRKKDVPSLIGFGAAIKRLSSRLPISVNEKKRFPRKKLN